MNDGGLRTAPRQSAQQRAIPAGRWGRRAKSKRPAADQLALTRSISRYAGFGVEKRAGDRCGTICQEW